MNQDRAQPGRNFARLAASCRQQREDIARVVAEGDAALAEFATADPPALALRGMGAIVHDFYTGIERLFESIAPELNGGLPVGPAWHRELLRNMTLDLPGIRPPLLGVETQRDLEELLRFRHLFRNLYGFELEWPRLRKLLERVPTTWAAVSADLDKFLEFLDGLAPPPLR